MSERPHDRAPAEGELPAGWGELVAASLDRTIDDAGRARLSGLVATDPRCARDFARAALLHDALSREIEAGSVGRGAARRVAVVGVLRRFAVAAVLLLAVGTLLWVGGDSRTALAAETELSRIAQAARTLRREYRITATDQDVAPDHRGDRRGPDRADRSDRPDKRRGDQRGDQRNDARGPNAKPSIDGATLHLGAAGAYVLERTAADGSRVVSGSDGVTSWVVPAQGAVRVSRDPRRFRGGLPGEQHDLPFVDPADGVEELRRSYAVSLGPERDADGRRTRTLVSQRRADTQRGPRDVTIEYDADSALVRRMTFGRLPQAGGGPRAVSLDLVAEHPLDAAFFSHDAHHAPGRKVVVEN